MAALGLRRLGLAAFIRSPLQGGAPVPETKTLGKAVEETATRECEDRPIERFGDARQKLSLQSHLEKAFKLHIGADVFLPTKSMKTSEPITPAEKPVHRDPFEGLPLKAWAEALGERVMPAYELIKEEQRRAKQTARATAKSAAARIQDIEVPTIAHVLPFTRWAANSKVIRSTFIAEDAKSRPKARLSWYHPDDTMVPRGWFTGGLLADLKYYKPFSKNT
eukprot:jgi/Botrbrau1/560/Bobra.0010s0029.1